LRPLAVPTDLPARFELEFDERAALLQPDPYTQWLTFKLRLLARGYRAEEWRDHERMTLRCTFTKTVNPPPKTSE
jgi:hypothetical protein